MKDDLDRRAPDESGDEYVDVGEAAAILNMTARSATRYQDRVRTYRAGVRIMYHRGDLEQLAEKMNARARPRKNEIQRREISELARSVGRLEGEIAAQQRQIETQRLELEQAQQLRIQLALVEAELARVQAELAEAHRHAGTTPPEPIAPTQPPGHRSWLRRLLDR